MSNKLLIQVNWTYGILAAITHAVFGYITYLRIEALPTATIDREWPLYILMYASGICVFLMFYFMSVLFATIEGPDVDPR